MERLFGTDGIRGIANKYPMTPWVALEVGMAVGAIYSQNGRRVVLGKDTRLSGYVFEYALTSGLCSTGVDVYLVGPFPTPGVAFLVSSMRASAGIVVSASHNPFYDNGIKIFNSDGFKLSQDEEERIEELVRDGEELSRLLTSPREIGKTFRLKEAGGRYIEFLKNTLPRGFKLDGVRVTVDCGNGATYWIAPLLFEELGADVVCINTSPDGFNINEGGATNPARLIEEVIKHKADVGFAYDGDGDRCIIVDERGEKHDGDEIMALCGSYMLKKGELQPKGVVFTVQSNSALEEFFKMNGCKVIRTKVGDRYVVEELLKNKFMFGGEKSGHIVFLRNSTTGDGILTSLNVLKVAMDEGRTISELFSNFTLYPECMVNLRVRRKIPIAEIEGAEEFIANVEKTLGGKGRVLVRYSGTEPILRIVVEAESDTKAQLLAKELESFFIRKFEKIGGEDG